MAIIPEELFGPIVSVGPQKRFLPHADGTKPAKFASAVGGPTLAIGTPLGFDTVAATWKVWAQAGTNGVNLIRAFVYPLPVILSATGEVLGTIFIGGALHRDDVVLPAGELQADLDAALKAQTVRNANMIVQGLDGVS